MSTRATLRGPQEGLIDPRVVSPDDGDGVLEGQALPRATLHHPGERGFRRVLVLPLDGKAPSGARRLEVVVDGWRFEVEVESEQRAALRERARRDRGDPSQSGPAEVRAIIPGVVLSVAVAPGDDVTAGQQLLVIEAMKMQNELRAPREGTIERVAVGPGTTIEVGDLLLVIS
jgi:biotin carboxyl carrier protein